LGELAGRLAKAGLTRVNVSLPSTRPERYKGVTGVNAHSAVVKGIRAAKASGLDPVKVNFVVLKGVNSDEVEDAIEFAGREGVILQLIELEPLGLAVEEYAKLHEPLDELEAQLADRAEEVVVRYSMHARRQYRIGDVWVEVVKPMHNPEFCAHCTRMRVTADGKLKPCLMRNDNLVDLTPALASGSDEELVRAFEEAVARREPFFGRAAPGCPLSR
ncbi:TPA: GTP 3',8-cyclase MoaA, partial [Candidatus Micrarchaeota archaeon]|nr:GTP 3',8-cyclase MoaA [Candidatus Micrarchaeota archaeon]